MKIFSLTGISKSGKTTTIEEIIKELKKRNYTVGSIKEIHFEKFKMDVDGTNTDRHKKAGSSLVTARGVGETDVLYQEKLTVNQMLKHYNQDYVVMEGVRDTAAPKIITAHDIAGIEERLDETVFAISGKISNEIDEYKGIPVINALTDIEKLVDLIEAKVFEKLPDIEKPCKHGCGYGCKGLCGAILRGEATRDCCVTGKKDVVLKIDGQEVPMVPFVEAAFRNVIVGFAKELRGYNKDGDIEICIKQKD